MKKTSAIVTSALVLTFLVSSGTFAQGGRRGAGPVYDPKTVETITGTLESVERVASRTGRTAGVHLLVKTDKETVPVHLGPSWYVDKQDVKITRGDRVDLTGSRGKLNGKSVLIAGHVKRGDKVLRLRDDSGVPQWSGQGGR
jgi:hypothetical protein